MVLPVSAKVEKAARRFFDTLLPRERWDGGDHPARNLILGAFCLYDLEWSDRKWNIASWEWPANTLAEGGAFTGEEPWTVLLRRAVELAGGR